MIVVAGGKSFNLDRCELWIPGKPDFQGFQVASADIDLLARLVSKTRRATVRVQWRKKEDEERSTSPNGSDVLTTLSDGSGADGQTTELE